MILRTAILVMLMLASATTVAIEIHQEKSLYRNIVVREADNRRCLLFTVKRGDRNQTCMDLQDPKRLVFHYVRMAFGGLLLKPDPGRILIVGLGGGSIPTALAELYPDATIDVVEIDEAVVRVARQYFNFTESKNLKVKVSDARVFIKRALLQRQTYDLIMLDAFTGDYIPEHLMTQEFLQESRDLLSMDGILVANTFSTSALYDHESETYQAVFGDYLNFKLPASGNRVIIAARQGLPSDFEIKSQAIKFAERLRPYGIEARDYPDHMSREKDWNRTRRILTDQYSPANLLRGED
jgi:spermidine synthase